MESSDRDRSLPEEMTAGAEPKPARSQSVMLYVHIPFCPSKCHFCGWVQGIPKRELLLSPAETLRKDYIRALGREIHARSEEVAGRGYVPNIVYWGGGTATALSEEEIEAVHAALATAFDLSAVSEATIEGSPDTVTPEKLALIRSLGYGRTSFGIQSMNDRRLRQIGRVHRADGAERAVRWAVEAGFDDINIDVMCGFPDESIEEVRHTVAEAVRLPATHISYYPYRPIQDSVMRQQLSRGQGVIDAGHQKAAYALGRTIIEDAGFPEYAMSYFGRPSLNDLAIFRVQQDWIGFGSGAHSLFDCRSRVHERGKLREYVTNPLVWDASVPACAIGVVVMLLGQGLSTFKGIERSDWLARTGQRLDETLRQPSLRGYLDWFRRRAGLVEDARGIRLARERMADAFIDMFLRMAS